MLTQLDRPCTPSEAGTRGGSAPKHNWTEEERNYVRCHYKQTHQSRREIALQLRVTEFSVAGQIAKMGIAKRSDRRLWTPKEDEILANLITRYSPCGVAKRMGRSLNSVTVRAQRLGLSRRYRDGWFTKQEVCEILGVDHKWVQLRIDKGQLKARPHQPGSVPQFKGGAPWHISAESLRKFIIEHSHEVTARNVDLITIVNLLTGRLEGEVC